MEKKPTEQDLPRNEDLILPRPDPRFQRFDLEKMMLELGFVLAWFSECPDKRQDFDVWLKSADIKNAMRH